MEMGQLSEEELAMRDLCTGLGIEITWYEDLLLWGWEAPEKIGVALYLKLSDAVRGALREHGVIK